MDTTDSDIVFNSAGRCNHCLDAEKVLRKHWHPKDGDEYIYRLSERIINSTKGKEYNCIVGVSGGVDSSYLLDVAVKKMGLKPLVVHVDAGWNSEIANSNIEKIVKKLKLDLHTHVVDWSDMSKLQIAFLRAGVPNQDIPQDHIFFSILYDFAQKNHIKHVLNGSNLTTESILPKSWGYDASDSIHLKNIAKKFGAGKLSTYKTMSLWKKYIFWPYICGMEIHKPLNYLDYDKEEAIKYLSDEYGWRDYGGKHFESKWTRFFQSYYLPSKFGFDKRLAHYSSMIVSGKMERDKALALIQNSPYDELAIAQEKTYIASKLGIALEELEYLIRNENISHLKYKNEKFIKDTLRKIKKMVFK